MFRSDIVRAVLFLVLFTGGWFFYLGKSPSSPPSKEEIPLDRSSSVSDQIRSGIRKDLWITQENGERLHHIIESDLSRIRFVKNENSSEIAEQLCTVRCRIEEKPAYQGDPLRRVRVLSADKGTYRYRDGSFFAKDVLISLYKVPKDRIAFDLQSYRPFLRGNAESIQFSPSEGKPGFTAFRFKAYVGDSES